jgi:hypothetical protein
MSYAEAYGLKIATGHQHELPPSEIEPLPMAAPSSPPLTMRPGLYLRKRREAAALGVIQAAANMAALPWALRQTGRGETIRCANRLNAAEAGELPLSRPEAELLRNVFRFDVDVYFELLAIHLAGPESGLVAPQVCRVCACSWCDPCPAGCAWAENDLCTACSARGAA